METRKNIIYLKYIDTHLHLFIVFIRLSIQTLESLSTMPKKETNGINFGEISTIRNILMGQQMDDYNNRFQELKDHLEKVEASLNSRLKEIEEQQVAQNREMQKVFTAKLDRLESLLLQSIKDVNATAIDNTTQERQNMAQLLAEMSERLLKK